MQYPPVRPPQCCVCTPGRQILSSYVIDDFSDNEYQSVEPNGQSFVAIDPNAFASGFGERLSDYMNSMRNLARVDKNVPVVIPGDPERAHIEECKKIGGIRYPPVLIDSMEPLSRRPDRHTV
ncbi:hypothetical protein X801_07560 [Opisthorchis viverrini]|uniref:Uncharacterized protein n=1 Tax=Opisthorchis viverrini TaxID=6198 RepID=A0A1S8WQF6_OPIVI|nr:hypothetical protein X801_07560 [Opisthorchis viverrini]